MRARSTGCGTPGRGAPHRGNSRRSARCSPTFWATSSSRPRRISRCATAHGPAPVPAGESTGPSGSRRPAGRPPPTRGPGAGRRRRPGPPRTQDRLGDWLLRAADGWTGRANSALPLGDPDRAAGRRASTRSRAGTPDRGQPPLINVPLPLAARRRRAGRAAAGPPAADAGQTARAGDLAAPTDAQAARDAAAVAAG